MEAPVPASALIHSATLVSAGIFLTLRLQPLLEISLIYHTVVPVVGAFTAFLGGFSAFFQTDLKRILAYSTISHCGFLFFLTCFNCVEFTLIYLYIHGFFKASAFLCVGNIIRFSKNFQDIRRMGSYWKFLPFEFYMLSFCLLSLSGLPFFFGFLIKHFLFLSFDYFFQSFLSFSFIFLAAFSGIFYSFRIFYFIFFDSKKARGSIYYNYADESTFSDKQAHSSFGGNVSIFFLVYSAVVISLIFIIWLYVLRSDITGEVSFYLGKTGAMHAYKTDLSLLFNFKILNTVISIFFFFLNFFR
jgi:NADH:ubiquinone oxidoreductase subunit 5 (subunit L)/multisubunit Na+/H+ antiporter MnhA subunit